MLAAVTKADLADTLTGIGTFTVFASTNSAFQALLDPNSSWNSLTDVPIATLTAVLLYHVANEAVYNQTN